MNNKGQSLVIFILLLPVIFILITGLWEIGNLSITQNRYKREIQDTIKYGLNHIEEENIEEKLLNLLNTNLEGTKDVRIENEEIEITVEYQYNSIYKAILKNKQTIKLNYIGYKENEKIVIESRWVLWL